MNAKEAIKKVLRNHFPNIPVLRKAMNKAKLREINRYIMEPEDVKAGEASLIEQARLVGKYALLWPEQAKMMTDLLDEYVSRCEAVGKRDDLEELRIKVLFACFAYGFRPDEFFAYNLEDRSLDDILSFLSDRELSNIVYTQNDIIDLGIFFDKFKTYEVFKDYYKREAISVSSSADREAFEEFAARHPIFVIKNVKLSKGDSVELIDSSEHDLSKLFEKMLAQGEYIVEERVVQSAQLAKLSLRSVNTVRVISLLTDHGVEIIACFIKVGQGQSFIDNGGAGGILSGIDSQTGMLVTLGFDEFCTTYEFHPDTKVPFVGFQLPDWDQAIPMVKEMAALTPGVRYIGWDIAHTDEGWIVIEANGSSQMIGPQMVWQRGFKGDLEAVLGAK